MCQVFLKNCVIIELIINANITTETLFAAGIVYTELWKVWEKTFRLPQNSLRLEMYLMETDENHLEELEHDLEPNLRYDMFNLSFIWGKIKCNFIDITGLW